MSCCPLTVHPLASPLSTLCCSSISVEDVTGSLLLRLLALLLSLNPVCQIYLHMSIYLHMPVSQLFDSSWECRYVPDWNLVLFTVAAAELDSNTIQNFEDLVLRNSSSPLLKLWVAPSNLTNFQHFIHFIHFVLYVVCCILMTSLRCYARPFTTGVSSGRRRCHEPLAKVTASMCWESHHPTRRPRTKRMSWAQSPCVFRSDAALLSWMVMAEIHSSSRCRQ